MKENFGEWAKETNYLNAELTIDDFEIRDVVEEIIEQSTLTKRLDLAEQALLCIIANLYKNHLKDKPLKISGAWDIWKSIKTSKVVEWATADRVRALLKVLIDRGDINKVAGVYTEDVKLVAKYWFKDNSTLLDILNNIKGTSPIHRIKSTQSIIVREEDGKVVDWTSLKCNKKKVRKMIANINRYNRFINRQEITFEISSAEIENSDRTLYKLMTTLQGYVNSNGIELSINNNRINRVRSIRDSIIILDTDSISYVVYKDSSININYRSTQGCYPYPYVLGGYEELKSMISSNDKCLDDISRFAFLSDFSLSGRIVFKTQRRIFNRGSFDLGGRFYLGAWNNLPKLIRDKFLINGEPVERLDFDGIHLRMLYHKLGIQFTDEAYVYSKSENNIDRERMKLITLIIINAKNHREGVYAINDKFKHNDLFVSSYHTNKLIKQFKEYHKPISEYFFNDAGVKLQNLDSNIMYNILNRLTLDQIPVMSVHDEVIFTTKHKELVEKYMLEEYEREIGFSTTVS
jgi:hypothetical protein